MIGHELPNIYGTATLNEKGQLVVPHEARQAMRVGPGSKLMVMGLPHGKGLIMIRIEDVEARFKGIMDAVQEAKNKPEEEPND